MMERRTKIDEQRTIEEWRLTIEERKADVRLAPASTPEGKTWRLGDLETWNVAASSRRRKSLHLPVSSSPRLPVSSSTHLPVSSSPRLCSLAPHGITLLEVLISMAILTVGVLGVASLLPMGRLALAKTDIADRTGACGRAALREVKIRRMLDPNMWATNPLTSSSLFFVDPLGYTNISGSVAGQSNLSRINLYNYVGGSTLSTTQAATIFMWQDDLSYIMPKDLTSGSAPTNGNRPMPVCDSSGVQQYDGRYSWFVMASPDPMEYQLYKNSNPANSSSCWPKTYSVAVVVCNRRDLSSTGVGEQVVTGGSCNSPGYGGVGFSCSGTTTLKNNEWAMLFDGNQFTWYRAVGVGYDGANTRMTLVGPDWNGLTTPSLLVIPSVTGVYTETIKLDDAETWNK